MPLPGGPADKLGNEYERHWTARVMLELLAADAGVICVEALDDEWRKYEFYVERKGRREGHQVKRQHGFDGAWSPASLNANGVMGAVRELLTRPDTEAHLVSTIGFDQLGELTERARDASDQGSFFEHYMKSKVANAAMRAFKESWGGQLSNGESFQMLRRIYLRSLSAADLQALVDAYAARWFADPAGVVEALGAISWANLGIRLGPTEIWAALRARGFHVRPDRDRESILSAIYGHTTLYLAGSQKIQGMHLGRSDATRLADLLRAGSQEVWMVGAAGSGKSEIARELVGSLRDERPTLAIRLDRMSATADPRVLAAQCGLDGSVVQALVAAAQGGDALLVLDQLDALSIVSGRRQDLLDAVREIVRQARMTSGIRLVVVCRRFDLDHDDGLSHLRERGSHVHSHDVSGLPDDEVRDVVARLGGIVQSLNATQIRLLQLPLHLALYAEVLRRDAAFTSFVTASHLFDRFIHLKRELVLQRQPGIDWHHAIKLVLERMSEEQALWVSWKWLLARMPPVSALVSENILVRSGDQVGFFHEVLFDHLFALHFDDDLPVAEWLKTRSEQEHARLVAMEARADRRQATRAAHFPRALCRTPARVSGSEPAGFSGCDARGGATWRGRPDPGEWNQRPRPPATARGCAVLIPAPSRILIAREPMDLRKSIDGLAAVCELVLREQPLDGTLFLFTNRRRDSLKALIWTYGGFTLLYKKLEQGRFRWPEMSADRATLTGAELAALLEALDLTHARRLRSWNPENTAGQPSVAG